VEEIELKDGLITLRPYRLSDAADVFGAVMESMPELSRWMPWAHARYSLADGENWLKMSANAWQEGSAYEFAIIDSEDGSYIGGCGLNHINNIDKLANLGYWVRSSRQGEGIATKVAALVARFGLNALKLNRIEILAAVENRASLRVAEKVGAVREAVLRHRISLSDKVHDAVLFSVVPADLTE